VKASASCPLGRPVKRPLEFSHFICGVVGPYGHALALTPSRTLGESRGPSLPPGSVVLKIIGTVTPSDSLPGTPELRLQPYIQSLLPPVGNTERGPPQFHRSLSLNPVPHTPRGSSALLQVLRAFHGLHRYTLGSAPPCSHFRGGTYEAAGFTLCYGPKGCSSSSDFVTSLRCQNFARHRRLATWPPGGYHDRTSTC